MTKLAVECVNEDNPLQPYVWHWLHTMAGDEIAKIVGPHVHEMVHKVGNRHYELVTGALPGEGEYPHEPR